MNVSGKLKRLSNVNLRTYTMVFALIVIAVFFQFMTKGLFFAPRNLSNLFRAMSITGVITMGMVLLIVSGNFDLAVGSIVAITGGIAAILNVWYGVDTIIAIMAALACGVAIGVWQGFWVAYKKVPSFIVTLGNMMILRGLYLVMTEGITITPLQKSFSGISQSYISSTASYILWGLSVAGIAYGIYSKRAARSKSGFKNEPGYLSVVKAVGGIALASAFVLVMNLFRGIPIPVIILIALVMVFIFISQKTRFGRRVYAIGGNTEAARLSGINVNRYLLVLYIITGLLSAVCGILLTSRLDGAVAAAGQAYEMDVISACVIGGTSLSGGKGTIVGAIIGALIIASLDNGMSLLNVTYYYQNIVKGLVLILAVWSDVAAKKTVG